jgi:NAD(P)-dependent dehydrogenase (short-subunit alcohol dehydrogenase family)
MDLGVKGKAFVVVGGTSGMGLATAEVLAEEGAALALVARNEPRTKQVAATLSDQYGVRVLPITADVSDSAEDVERAVRTSVDGLGEIDGVAVTTGTDYAHSRKPLAEMGDDDWKAAFADITLGTIRCCNAVVPHLVERGGGTIVTTAAYSVRAPDLPAIPYSTLKTAVAGYTKGLAKAYGSHGVRANCVCPGGIKSEGLTQILQTLARERGVADDIELEREMLREWRMDVALGRLGRTREVGELIAFLLSQRAGYINGALINIDGGTNF